MTDNQKPEPSLLEGAIGPENAKIIAPITNMAFTALMIGPTLGLAAKVAAPAMTSALKGFTPPTPGKLV